MGYTASKSLPQGRSVWVLSFRHPLRRDSRGKLGLKVRRSLDTSDETEAERLRSQMDELLANKSLHNPLQRSEAKKRGFHPIVLDAFYDGLKPSASDSAAIRETEIAFPAGLAPKVLLAGATGSGKTSLLRQLIGSDPKNDRFPSTSTARTTTCDIEVIVANGSHSFRAVVTFMPRWEARANVAECVSNACLGVIRGLPEEKIADRLLHHPDQVFRLSYVIGSYRAKSGGDDDWRYEGEREENEGRSAVEDNPVSDEQREQMRVFLKDVLEEITFSSRTALQKTERDLEVRFGDLPPNDRDFAEEYFEDVLQDSDGFDAIVDDILEQIFLRFAHLPPGDRKNRPGGWPECWTCQCPAPSRGEFIRRVRWFSSNYAGAFGSLVAPLVNGIRVQGPFTPRFTSEREDMVLIDGQGFGHTPDSAASVSTHVTKRYGEVDAILLVDNAAQPMLPASLSILRSVLAAGYQRKLAIAFTHVDQVVGPNLPDFDSKKAHVTNSVVGALRNLREALGASLVEAFEQQLDSRCLMLGWLDKPVSEKSKGPAHELEGVLAFCRDSILPETPTEAVPVYDPTALLFTAQSAGEQFQKLWKARLGYIVLANVERKPWQTVKALNRRVAERRDKGEYRDLRPVAELLARFSEAIGRFLEKPLRWHGPSEATQRAAALDKVRQRVFGALDHFVEDRLLNAPFLEWERACGFSGRLSTFRRAGKIKEIVEEAAPIPNETMSREVSKFLAHLRLLVCTAIREAGGRLQLEDDLQAEADEATTE